MILVTPKQTLRYFMIFSLGTKADEKFVGCGGSSACASILSVA